MNSCHLLAYQEYFPDRPHQLLLKVFEEVPFELGLGGRDVGKLEFIDPAIDFVYFLYG